jgi:hypothetical protein
MIRAGSGGCRPTWRTWAVATLALGALAVGGCTLFTSFSGLTGGVRDGAADGPPGCSGATRFCTTTDVKPYFCSDFDTPDADLSEGFVRLSSGGVGGTSTLDSLSFVSCPHSARMTMFGFDAGQTSFESLVGTLWTSVTPPPPSLVCSFQWNPHALSSAVGDSAIFFKIDFFAAPGVVVDGGQGVAVELRLAIKSTGDLLVLERDLIGGSDSLHDFGVSPALDQWHSIVVETAPSVGTAYTVSVDGKASPYTLGRLVPQDESGLQIVVGPDTLSNTASTGWDFAYDNILCY